MSDKVDGGPAFSCPASGSGEDFDSGSYGMSLRDYLAAHALAGLCANESFCNFLRGVHWTVGDTETRNDRGNADVATTAYGLADAMLAERAK